jgi:hypothetical protein
MHDAACMSLCPYDQSEPNPVRHPAEPIVGEAKTGVINSVQANRSPDRCFRIAPLGRLWRRETSSLFRDRRFGTPRGEIEHSNGCRHVGLAERQKRDFVEYMKALLKCSEKTEKGEIR